MWKHQVEGVGCGWVLKRLKLLPAHTSDSWMEEDGAQSCLIIMLGFRYVSPSTERLYLRLQCPNGPGRRHDD